MNTTTPPSGWYPDPNDPGGQRYWDGSQWTEHTAAGSGGQADTGSAQYATTQISSPDALQAGEGAPNVAATAFDPYSPHYDPRQLPDDYRQGYMHHQLTEFNAAGWVALSIITFGIFGMVHHGLKHGKMPPAKHDDPTAGKAVGFQFIPFFSLYWGFVIWPRLADRINFQYKLRGLQPPLSRDFMLWTWIMLVAGVFIGVTILAWLVMAPIAGYQIQKAANQLANGQADAQAGLAPAVQSPSFS